MTTRYNPFEDKTLHYSQPQDSIVAGEDRTPFNDVIRHADIVQGYQPRSSWINSQNGFKTHSESMPSFPFSG